MLSNHSQILLALGMLMLGCAMSVSPDIYPVLENLPKGDALIGAAIAVLVAKATQTERHGSKPERSEEPSPPRRGE